jgi:CDP-paratose 2-epimerase
MSKVILVTGSSGLIGSEVCSYFSHLGYEVHGIDNNMRASFFGPQGDTVWMTERLKKEIKNFRHYPVSICDRDAIETIVREVQPSVIVHAAAQPSHDLAAQIPLGDFDTNAVGTMNMLEMTRRHARDAVFVHMSTNKVYGERPNRIARMEFPTRFDFINPDFFHGVHEHVSIDQSTHSVFGASKVAADVMVQEYGRYYGMKTCCLRGGCLTGPRHSGVQLHGFLSYLVKCNLEKKVYTVYGYSGKQVRDNIHSLDVVRFIEEFVSKPVPGEVYNIGGGKDNAVSILEAFKIVESITGIPMEYQIVDQPRVGDHVVYYSDLRKCKRHFPNWKVTQSVTDIISQIVKVNQ